MIINRAVELFRSPIDINLESVASMFFSGLTSRRTKPFSIITSKSMKRKELSIEERMKFQSLNYQTPSRSKAKLIVNLVILIVVITSIIYLNVKSNIRNVKIVIDKQQLEKVTK